MSNIHQLKRRIKTTDDISQITKAMEMVAASKMKKAQDQALATRPFAQELENLITTLLERKPNFEHPLLQRNQDGQDLALLVTTDKGLCGPLNTNLFKVVEEWWQKQADPTLIVVGKKGVKFAQRAQHDLTAQFTDLPDKLSSQDLLPITALLLEKYQAREVKSVTLIYTRFINTLSQQPMQEPLLPLTDFLELKPKSAVAEKELYFFEPKLEDLLFHLLSYFFENKVFQVLLEAKASEHSARMVAMKNASENAADLKSELELMFNKSRQEEITNELLDMTTAALTLKQDRPDIINLAGRYQSSKENQFQPYEK